MAETILFDFVKFIVTKLSSPIFNGVKLALGNEDELERIKNNLSSIQAVLRDAEKQQITSDSVRNWLGNLQDFVYDIDDLLDDIATEVAIHSKIEGRWSQQVRKFFSSTNFLLLRLLWAHQIKNLRSKLEQIVTERNLFPFSPESTDSAESSSRETHSMINKSRILGRDSDKEAIVCAVLDCGDCESLSVVPIVGIGGIGKTTLAQLVYNDDRIGSSFDVRLWVYVSEKFNIKRILRQILCMVTGENMLLGVEQPTLEQLRLKINDALKDRKYVVILDDLWNQDLNKWNQLKELLDVGAKGSTVIVTTRDLNVASMVKKTVDEYGLGELSDETCLVIFKQLAFKDGEETEPRLLDLAEKVIGMSRGIPLLVVTLGNLLRRETDEREWRNVMRKLEEGHEDILNVLKLSYDQLPSYAKLCFRVFSIYDKGTCLFPIPLESMWMALGFLPYDVQEQGLEYAGMKCINELLSKSLFMKVSNAPHQMLSSLQMHDFLYDLAKSMSSDELAIINRSTREVSKKTRYMRLDEDDLSKQQRHRRLLTKAKKARLLRISSSEHSLTTAFLHSIISNLKCLRVLDLSNSQFEVLPNIIGCMKHLRYLNLGNNLRIKLLPESICNLFNLQSLILGGCTHLQEIPADIGRLENLIYLSVTTRQEFLPEGLGLIRTLQKLILLACPRLGRLPTSTKQLARLESLWIEDCKELDLTHGLCSLEGLNRLLTLGITSVLRFQALAVGVKGLPFMSLQTLMVRQCEGLSELTGWIECLICLKTLVIGDCPNLVGLPHTIQLLRKLETLLIYRCPMLNQRYAPTRGHDWHLICNIPYVEIDGETKNDPSFSPNSSFIRE